MQERVVVSLVETMPGANGPVQIYKFLLDTKGTKL
jgi:hypothetical protein